MKQRLSPSGPVIGDISTGHIVQSVRVVVPALSQGSLSTVVRELREDMNTQSGTTYRPVLKAVTNKVRAEVLAPLQTADTWTTSTVTVRIEGSADGSNWTELASMTRSIPSNTVQGVAGTIQRETSLDMRTAALDPSLVTGWSEGNDLQLRATFQAATVTGSPELPTSNLYAISVYGEEITG